jgi:hypothetical protein
LDGVKEIRCDASASLKWFHFGKPDLDGVNYLLV